MKLPAMVIIFNKEMADDLSDGLKCAFAAHGAMWLNRCLDCPNSEYSKNMYSKEYNIKRLWEFIDWLKSDYRKLVMTSPDTIDNLFEKFKSSGVPVYLQKTSHDIKLGYEEYYDEKKGINEEYEKIIKKDSSICISVFIWKDEHKKLLDGCELL